VKKVVALIVLTLVVLAILWVGYEVSSPVVYTSTLFALSRDSFPLVMEYLSRVFVLLVFAAIIGSVISWLVRSVRARHH